MSSELACYLYVGPRVHFAAHSTPPPPSLSLSLRVVKSEVVSRCQSLVFTHEYDSAPISSNMKAVVFKGPGKVVIEDRPMPAIQDAGDIIVKVDKVTSSVH